jgi:hypothetical protein
VLEAAWSARGAAPAPGGNTATAPEPTASARQAALSVRAVARLFMATSL